MLRLISALGLVLVMALPARAAPADDLLDALKLGDMLDIMREEGLAYGQELADDMFPGGGGARWSAILTELYDTTRMEQAVAERFTARLDPADIPALLRFFTSEAGQRIVNAELAARRAMVADRAEEAAREAYRLRATAEDDPRLGQLDRFIEINDLLEANVAGALNASFQFYRGLVEGGALEMSESEILQDVWSQEEATRDDTREWLYAYLLLAYDGIGAAALDSYITLSGSPEGRAMNRALFAGFNRMYDDISYALGLAAAQQMRGQDL